MTLGERRVAGESAGQQREGEGWEAEMMASRAVGPEGDKQGGGSTAQPWASSRTALRDVQKGHMGGTKVGEYSYELARKAGVSQSLWEADAKWS